MNKNKITGLYIGGHKKSAATYQPKSSTVCQSKKLLPIAQSELWLRQSDALFHHVLRGPMAGSVGYE